MSIQQRSRYNPCRKTWGKYLKEVTNRVSRVTWKREYRRLLLDTTLEATDVAALRKIAKTKDSWACAW